MRVVLTNHALARIVARGLRREWVERVAATPDWSEPDPRPDVTRHFGVVPEAGGRTLRVAAVDESGARRVLSAHLDRAAGRRRP